MTQRNTILLLAAALALAGCDVTGGNAPGTSGLVRSFSAASGLTGRNEQAAAAAVTELGQSDLLSPKISVKLDDEDRRLAAQAQLDALDHGVAGAPVPWRNPSSGNYGNIVPGPPYNRQGATCRGYSHSVSIAGQLDIARGTVCRSGEGAWTVATS